ncbi:methylamine utilization protein MauJ [Corallococcus sicarius]|uniref:methylamine utilization protein MauJ n=1 Tax=Corallococcus sicarius TaxID=2316726 RepID=UPI0011C3E824|nr:methylamine utilization protein MauJ [Corallococcus sicarius]
MSRNSKLKRAKRRRQEAKDENRERLQPDAEPAPAQEKPLATTISLDSAKLGPPGILHQLHLAASDSPDSEQDKQRFLDPEERDFRLLVHLSKVPNSSSGDFKMFLEPSEGASLIYALPEAVDLALETPSGKVIMHLNSARECSALELWCRATNYNNVFGLYSKVVAPLIDNLSYQINIPIHVREIAIWDPKHNILTASYVAPFVGVTLGGDQRVYIDLLRPYYALYREGMTNPSVFYQFLCYSKILEGIFRKTHQKIIGWTKENGLEAPRFTARVEEDPVIQGDARKWIGKGIKQTFDNYLEKKFRNAIAHFSNNDEEPIVVSDYMASATISGNLLLARQCARTAIGCVERMIHDADAAFALRQKG